MALRVDAVKPSKSGQSWIVTAGGKMYFSKCGGIEHTAGKMIEAETSPGKPFPDGKESIWINKYSIVEQAPAQVQPDSRPLEGGRLYSYAPVAPIWQPLVSNCLAAAITAKVITEPEQLTQWALAAKRAIEAAYKDEAGEIEF